MKGWKKDVLAVIGIIVVVGSLSLVGLSFATVPDVYVIKNPTQEQVETLIKGDPNNRVWFHDAAQLYQGSSLIKMSFRTRYFEGGRIAEFLDGVGVKYELIKEGE